MKCFNAEVVRRCLIKLSASLKSPSEKVAALRECYRALTQGWFVIERIQLTGFDVLTCCIFQKSAFIMHKQFMEGIF